MIHLSDDEIIQKIDEGMPAVLCAAIEKARQTKTKMVIMRDDKIVEVDPQAILYSARSDFYDKFMRLFCNIAKELNDQDCNIKKKWGDDKLGLEKWYDEIRLLIRQSKMLFGNDVQELLRSIYNDLIQIFSLYLSNYENLDVNNEEDKQKMRLYNKAKQDIQLLQGDGRLENAFSKYLKPEDDKEE
ncbi:MAG: hypothetical protein FWF24_04115 [Alphaproteobacteria bacterium]|nr:hypothetical protein [Alphaproteobacteria bacterium]